MIDLQELIDIDKYMLLALNGSDSLFWDGCMSVYTTTLVWIPLILVLLYVLFKNNNLRTFFILLAMFVLVFMITNTLTSVVFKPMVERLRPSFDSELMYLVDIVNDYRSYSYSFMSGHAANSFGIATLAILLIRNTTFSLSVIVWALINCYSRIYLGVHYPGDIIAGIVLGIISGVLVYRLYRFLCKKLRNTGSRDWLSSLYTKSGYMLSDVHLLLVALYGTYAAIPIIAFYVFPNTVL